MRDNIYYGRDMSRVPAKPPMAHVTRVEYDDLLKRVEALEKFNEDLVAGPENLPATVSTEAVSPAANKRGCRLPTPWMPKDSTVDQIRTEFPWVNDDDFIREHRVFCDYWYSLAGAKAAKRDWEGTWRNWMRRSFEKLPQVSSRRAGMSTVDAKVANLQAGKE